MNAIQKLDAIDEFESELDHLKAEKQRLMDEAMPAEVRQRIADIEAEFSGKAEAVSSNIEKLEAEVLANCETIKGAHYMCTHNKGRVSWDGKKLEGMMSIIPALKDARKEGQPTVSFRSVQS